MAGRRRRVKDVVPHVPLSCAAKSRRGVPGNGLVFGETSKEELGLGIASQSGIRYVVRTE